MVDDEPAIRRFVETALTEFGYRVSCADSGASAIEMARRLGPFDLLVTDLMMPGMRGDELAKVMRSTQADLKVLYLTGYSDKLFEVRAKLWDHESVLEKPVTLAQLHDAVSIAVYKHRGGPPRAEPSKLEPPA